MPTTTTLATRLLTADAFNSRAFIIQADPGGFTTIAANYRGTFVAWVSGVRFGPENQFAWLIGGGGSGNDDTLPAYGATGGIILCKENEPLSTAHTTQTLNSYAGFTSTHTFAYDWRNGDLLYIDYDISHTNGPLKRIDGLTGELKASYTPDAYNHLGHYISSIDCIDSGMVYYTVRNSTLLPGEFEWQIRKFSTDSGADTEVTPIITETSYPTSLRYNPYAKEFILLIDGHIRRYSQYGTLLNNINGIPYFPSYSNVLFATPHCVCWDPKGKSFWISNRERAVNVDFKGNKLYEASFGDGGGQGLDARLDPVTSATRTGWTVGMIRKHGA